LNQNKEKPEWSLVDPDFPLSSKYDPQWVLRNEMGPNVLWLTEWLCKIMDLKQETLVLDMGCGRAMSSVFLALEFGCRVFSNDLWINPTDNYIRICEWDLGNRIYPIHAEAHDLPFAHNFFDTIINIDSYQYFGTNDLYLDYLIRFLKPNGQIGIVVPGLIKDFPGEVPEYLVRKQTDGSIFWVPDECLCFHTRDWWKKHWEKTGLVKIEVIETMPDGWLKWLNFYKIKRAAGFKVPDCDILALIEDQGKYMGFIRLVARKI
jgi:SAM-dependent methyltransferase